MASFPRPPTRVTFHPDVQFERNEKPRRHPKLCSEMTTETFRKFQAEDVTDPMLVDAAQLFSEHYGIWGTTPPGHQGSHGKPGIRSFAGAMLPPAEPDPTADTRTRRTCQDERLSTPGPVPTCRRPVFLC